MSDVNLMADEKAVEFRDGTFTRINASTLLIQSGGREYRLTADRPMDWLITAVQMQDGNRQQIAAMAMQGLAPAYAQGGDFMEGHVAAGAVKLADALLKELAK